MAPLWGRLPALAVLAALAVPAADAALAARARQVPVAEPPASVGPVAATQPELPSAFGPPAATLASGPPVPSQFLPVPSQFLPSPLERAQLSAPPIARAKLAAPAPAPALPAGPPSPAAFHAPAAPAFWGAPAPAPAPALGLSPPSPAPSQTPLELTILERLKLNSERMGKIATSLLDVQGGLSTAQQEALDKVFDISNIESFLHKHQHLTDEGKLLDTQRIALTKKAEELRVQLEAERADTETNRALAPELESHNATKHLYTLVNQQLKKANLELGENLKNVNFGEMSEESTLEAAKANLEAQKKITAELQLEVAEALKRQAACQKELGDVVGDLSKLDEAAIKSRNATRAMEAQAKQGQVKMATQLNRLKERLFKARANKAMMQSQQVTIQEKFSALEAAGKVRIKQMRNQFGSVIGKVKADEALLAASEQKRQQMEEHISYVARQVKELEMMLQSGHLAILHANNTQLKTELTQVNVQLVQSQEVLRKHQLQASQSNVTALALMRETQDNQALAQKVKLESLQQVEKDKQEASALILWAERATMVAESAKLQDCADLWDRENEPVLNELRECRAVPHDLAAAKAQVVALSGALGRELGSLAALQLER